MDAPLYCPPAQVMNAHLSNPNQDAKHHLNAACTANIDQYAMRYMLGAESTMWVRHLISPNWEKMM
jgi:hypothetical protein